jgi:hypothetical protein
MGDGVPYAAFALTALIPWNNVATAVPFGSSALANLRAPARSSLLVE